MRLLHIIGTMDPASGGPAEAVRMMLEFAPPGLASEVASCDSPDAPFLADLGCPAHGFARKGPGYSYTPRLLPWLRKHRFRFDGAIVHGLWAYPSLASWRAFAGELPYAVFPHGMLDPYFNRVSALRHAKKLAYWFAVERRVLRDAHRVLFTNTVERDLAGQSFPLSQWAPQIFSLGTRPAAAVEPASFFALCPALRARRFLLFLGRIDPKKGCDHLLAAFHRFSAEDPGLHLVMAGPDPANWRAELMRSLTPDAAERVHWPGMLTGDAKFAALASCEAFILPSHQENFGIAVTEALAYGRPVLLSDKINIAHDIAAEGCGFVETDTVQGTLRLLQRWQAAAPAERDVMSAQALTTFQQRYNMQHNTQQLLEIFTAPEAR